MNFKSVLLIGVLAVLCITFASAQKDVSIGVRGGLTLPSLTGGSSDNPLNTGYSTSTRLGAAIFPDFDGLRYKLNHKVLIIKGGIL